MLPVLVHFFAGLLVRVKGALIRMMGRYRR